MICCDERSMFTGIFKVSLAKHAVLVTDNIMATDPRTCSYHVAVRSDCWVLAAVYPKILQLLSRP